MSQKAVLNRNNRKEYVLVFNEGYVYYSLHKTFEESFKGIIEEWSSGMRSCGVNGKFSDHRALYYPSEDREEDDVDDHNGHEVARNNSSNDDDSDNGRAPFSSVARFPNHEHQPP